MYVSSISKGHKKKEMYVTTQKFLLINLGITANFTFILACERSRTSCQAGMGDELYI